MREKVLISVKTNGLTLAQTEHTNDKEIVMAAVKNYGHALKFASSSLRDDKDVVLAALSNDGSSIQYASDSLQHDKDVIKASFKNNMYALFYEYVIYDKELVLAAVKQYGAAIHFIPRSLRSDRDIIRESIKENGNMLRFFKEDPILIYYAKHSKHPKKLTSEQETTMSTFMNQKNKETYNFYLIKTFFSGHEVGFLNIIHSFL